MRHYRRNLGTLQLMGLEVPYFLDSLRMGLGVQNLDKNLHCPDKRSMVLCFQDSYQKVLLVRGRKVLENLVKNQLNQGNRLEMIP